MAVVPDFAEGPRGGSPHPRNLVCQHRREGFLLVETADEHHAGAHLAYSPGLIAQSAMYSGDGRVCPHEGERPRTPHLGPIQRRGTIEHALGMTTAHDEQELLALVATHEQRRATVDNHLFAKTCDGGGDAIPGGIIDLDGECGFVSHGGFNGTASGPSP